MAYCSTATAPERRNPTKKGGVWDFFPLSGKTHPANNRQPLQLRRNNRPTPAKPASGIPLWPSRDPIDEMGGVNLYEFVNNMPSMAVDTNGEFFWVPFVIAAIWWALEEEVQAPTPDVPVGHSTPSPFSIAAQFYLGVCAPIDAETAILAAGGKALGCCKTVASTCCCKAVEFVESRTLSLGAKELNAIKHIFNNPTHDMQNLLAYFKGDAEAAFRALAAKARSVVTQQCSGSGLPGLRNVRVEVTIDNIKYEVKGWINDAGDFIADTAWKQ
ncbi:MAG: hypothetical protein WCK77_17830 [Verrucomicrobiota bacterium]